MSITQQILEFKSGLPSTVQLVAVSKTHPASAVLEAYQTGHRIFGENKVQELVEKHNELPKDIEWHLIGHLQSNKVKYIAPFVHLIHSVDSLKLLQEINKQALKNNRMINCLLQIYIAHEETKFGLSFEEAETLLASEDFRNLKNICITGLMGMATNTDSTEQIKNEFHRLNIFFHQLKKKQDNFELSNLELSNSNPSNLKLTELSMGMSSDYKIAIAEGSTLIRVGSTIFGNRNYAS